MAATSLIQLPLALAERSLLPDAALRFGIRRLLRQRLDSLAPEADPLAPFIAQMDRAPLALMPERANEQHYEVDANFFDAVLGPKRKYSCCFWEDGAAARATLALAEEAALRISCERARIADGMHILELGCGWGSFTLWLAHRFPNARITAVSNSNAQREFIVALARRENLRNVNVITADMNQFAPAERYDRVVSVEMFEHMRNWRALFARVHSWLKPEGLFFMHVFCHRTHAYEFVEADASDWMTRYFFAGGMMPADALATRFQDDLNLVERWRWNGRHYEQTANAWLANMDARRAQVMPSLQRAYGEHALLWWSRWRMFFMACAELFGYRGGEEWFVAHYLFRKPGA